MDTPEVEELIRSMRYVKEQVHAQLMILESLISWLEMRKDRMTGVVPDISVPGEKRCGVTWEGARTHANPDLPAHHCAKRFGHDGVHFCTCGIIASDNDIKGNAV